MENDEIIPTSKPAFPQERLDESIRTGNAGRDQSLQSKEEVFANAEVFIQKAHDNGATMRNGGAAEEIMNQIRNGRK